jgi:serine/threonine-protein kinase
MDPKGGSEPEAEPATVIERPPLPRSPSETARVALRDPGVVTPEQALTRVEALRVRGLIVGMAVASLVTSGLVLVLGGDPFAARLHAAALAISGVLSAAYALVFRDPDTYRPSAAFGLIALTIIVAITGYYYWGVFSAYAAVVPITAYVMTSGASLGLVVIGTILTVLAQSALALATVLGWIESRGLVEPVRGTQTTQLVAIVLIQLLVIGSMIGGRDARRTTKRVLDEHDRALRALAQREAQLAEAVAEARAAREEVGGPGRFTGHTLDDLRLGDVIGRGAMGEIYAAERADGTACAVKLIAPHLVRDDATRERFQRESAIVSALASPHIVRVLAVSPPDAAMPYLAMERLHGEDLAQQIERTPVSPLAEVVELVRQVAAGLDAAHGAGVIHRDLKPQNLVAIGPSGDRTWKILDFGASRWIDGDGTLTQDRVVGTPGYMSPEQALREPLDARSDVYALGVIVYRLVTGAPAVVPGELAAMLHEVVYRVPLRPGRLADVPLQVEEVLAIAMAKRPADRFASAGELAEALAAAADGRLPLAIGDRARAVIRGAPWGTWVQRPR